MSIYPAIFAVQLAAAERLPFCNAARRARRTAQRWLSAWHDMGPEPLEVGEPEPEPEPEPIAPVAPRRERRTCAMSEVSIAVLNYVAEHPGSTRAEIRAGAGLGKGGTAHAIEKHVAAGRLRLVPIEGAKPGTSTPHGRYYTATTQAAESSLSAHTHAGANNS